MEDLTQVKQQLANELAKGLNQLVVALVDQYVPNQVAVDKAKALEALTTQELLAEVSRRVG